MGSAREERRRLEGGKTTKTTKAAIVGGASQVAPRVGVSAWKATGTRGRQALGRWGRLPGATRKRIDREEREGHEALPFVLFVSFVVLPLR